MSKFFNDTTQGLLEAIAIKSGEIKMEEVPDMPAKTLRAANLMKKGGSEKIKIKWETTRIEDKVHYFKNVLYFD